MKQETKILIIAGVGAAVVSGLALAGYKYKKAAEALQFGVGSISPLGIDDNGLQVLINVKIKNASSFVFPVPQAFVKFNVAGKEVGAAQTTQWQTIGANAETVLPLVGYFRINELGGLITLLYNATTLPKDILYSGYVDFGKFQIPFNSSYAIGKYYDSTIKYGGRIDQYWTGNLENYAPSLVGRSLKSERDIPFITDVEKGVKHFGLHGIEFGNWMNQSDRLSHFMASMVSFHDLAHVLNINPVAIGVNEELTLALGARGQGGSAAAHYERGTRFVINITKTVGAGSLAHEYGHFLDNVMAVRSGDAKNEFASGGRSTRTEVNEDLLNGNGFKSLLEKIIYTLYWDEQGNPTAYLKQQKQMDSDYLFRRTEVFARTFEQYVRLKLRKHKMVNDYLVTRYPSPSEPPIQLVRLVEPLIDTALQLLFVGNTETKADQLSLFSTPSIGKKKTNKTVLI